jgi:TatA/E family protein of Tat protein translocase
MLPRIGPVELILILVIVTMLFGVGKLPEVFGSVGRGLREFRRASTEPETEKEETVQPQLDTTAPAVTVAPVEPVASVETPVTAAPVTATTVETVVPTDGTTPPTSA